MEFSLDSASSHNLSYYPHNSKGRPLQNYDLPLKIQLLHIIVGWFFASFILYTLFSYESELYHFYSTHKLFPRPSVLPRGLLVAFYGQ